MTTPPPVRQSYVPALASMRGFAAVGILLYHASVDFGVDDDIWRYSYLKIAVTFFFILSGFVLTRGWRDEAKTLQWQRRAARILPMYMLAWLLTLAGRSYVHWIPGQGELLATLLMVQAWWPSPRLSMAVNPVGWSLSCEVLCYLLLPFVIPTLRRANDVVLRRVTTVVIGWAVVGTALTGVFPINGGSATGRPSSSLASWRPNGYAAVGDPAPTPARSPRWRRRCWSCWLVSHRTCPSRWPTCSRHRSSSGWFWARRFDMRTRFAPSLAAHR